MKPHRIVYDVKLRRPGCVLLQAAMGGTVSASQIEGMGEWLIAPTPDMHLYEATEEELEKLRRMRRHPTPVRSPSGAAQ